MAAEQCVFCGAGSGPLVEWHLPGCPEQWSLEMNASDAARTLGYVSQGNGLMKANRKSTDPVHLGPPAIPGLNTLEVWQWGMYWQWMEIDRYKADSNFELYCREWQICRCGHNRKDHTLTVKPDGWVGNYACDTCSCTDYKTLLAPPAGAIVYLTTGREDWAQAAQERQRMAYSYAHKQEEFTAAVPQKAGALTVTVNSSGENSVVRKNAEGSYLPVSGTDHRGRHFIYNADGCRQYLIVGDKPFAWSPPDRKTILREQLAAEERKEQERVSVRLRAEQQEKQEAAKRFAETIAACAERIRGYVSRMQQEREEKRQAMRAEAARTGNRFLTLDLDD
jgi:hypothetical protein